MAARKSLTPFYIVLGVIAVGGGALIASGAFRAAPPPLTLDTIGQLATGPRGVTIGSDSAPVEVVEFSDFECPVCARLAVVTMPDVMARLIQPGRVKWRFVHYPLPIHARAPAAHLAAACANEQGRFWPMHDLLYQYQGDWSASRDVLRSLEQLAERAGVDRGRYRTCMTERSVWGTVLADKALGDSLGILGTPSLYVNGQYWDALPYSADALRKVVDSIAPLPPQAGTAR